MTEAEKLMRSRYDAFVREDWHYIANTSISQTFAELSTSEALEWMKLDVLNASEDTVEFKAYYKLDAEVYLLHEKSTFVYHEGMLKYKEGKLFPTKILSNEMCPCGSGKKFKKCCA